jgi:hypothetical protein
LPQVAVVLEFLSASPKFSHRWKHKDNKKLKKKLKLTNVEAKIIKAMKKNSVGTVAKKDAEAATAELNQAYKGAWAAGQKRVWTEYNPTISVQIILHLKRVFMRYYVSWYSI